GETGRAHYALTHYSLLITHYSLFTTHPPIHPSTHPPLLVNCAYFNPDPDCDTVVKDDRLFTTVNV
ncbi:hypothetical protein, partial [Chamaesiphon polymorphus]|uniref:hypothetical protein n=1 Tax=Chamaesiphon polymorphus TaxID=2107691 RepID=UPI001C632ABC